MKKTSMKKKSSDKNQKYPGETDQAQKVEPNICESLQNYLLEIKEKIDFQKHFDSIQKNEHV